MIARLSGNIAAIKGNSVILMVGGVGYQVAVTVYALGKLAGQDEVMLHIHTHVREDALLLYGFLDEEELHMFELLITISGIGPKVALSILSIADTKTIRTAIVNKDPSILYRVSGVGKKTAERVIIELQNKVEAVDLADQEGALADQEALEALTALGYSVTQARDALKQVPKEGDISGRIRQALKNLGK
ncbi:MAG: Holliday junction DNA helicase RuvA [Candidatus Moranbacteria bacterium RIFCSPHIGHO2_01_FULL_55_24]|nr:MAG: Holliday junction DNA helicase RuvA [Candidatus Moranbacteria bacterium RIFCSPHIGHO2_01_FULL_55_24]